MGANDGRCPETDPAQARSCKPARGTWKVRRRATCLGIRDGLLTGGALAGPLLKGCFPRGFDMAMAFHLFDVLYHHSRPWTRQNLFLFAHQTPVYKIMLLNAPVGPI
jgi:hypothetical protein